MRLLRGVQPTLKVTLVFVSALLLMLVLIVLHPRPAHAEGLLPRTVKCLVQVITLERCQEPSRTTVPAPQQAPPASESTTRNTQQAPASEAPSETQNASQTPSSTGVGGEPLEQPKSDAPAPVTPVHTTPEEEVLGASRIIPSEYIAYFNTYSHYALEAEQASAAHVAVIQPSNEGWKILGAAWYWWLLGIGAVATAGVCAKRIFLRRYSVLSKRP